MLTMTRPEPKNLLTNLIALALVALGLSLPQSNYSNFLYFVGTFAFSGAITNWLAIYMLFEKVPFLYGSGVIPRQFQTFKLGIKELILKQFFTQERIEQFSVQNLDYNLIFEKLVEAIEGSSLGSMLSMVGGKTALEPLREPVIEKIESAVAELFESANLSDKIEHIVQARLDELTPQLVKEIIQRMIRQHLGWLVVWGGVFGGIICAGMFCLG